MQVCEALLSQSVHKLYFSMEIYEYIPERPTCLMASLFCVWTIYSITIGKSCMMSPVKEKLCL